MNSFKAAFNVVDGTILLALHKLRLSSNVVTVNPVISDDFWLKSQFRHLHPAMLSGDHKTQSPNCQGHQYLRQPLAQLG